MNKETLYQSILDEAVQNAHNIHRNYGHVYSEERILRDVEMEYKSKLGKLEYNTEGWEKKLGENKPTEAVKEDEDLIRMRNNMHNADLSNQETEKAWMYDLKKIIKSEEAGGKKLDSILYVHTVNGNATVGYGFDMEKNRKESWNRHFADFDGQKPDFDKVKIGGSNLTENQAEHLLDKAIIEHTEKTKKLLNTDPDTGNSINCFDKLKPNEKISLISAEYNGGGNIVGRRLRRNIQQYTKTSNQRYLEMAVYELGENGGKPYLQPELRERRRREAILLASYKSPLYVKPNEGNLLNEKKWFTWNHSGSGNPRSEHLGRDGKKFLVGGKEWQELGKFNCRCSYTIVE